MNTLKINGGVGTCIITAPIGDGSPGNDLQST